MRSHAHWILVALCLGSASAHAETLSLTPAWDGWSRPGRVTEVELRIGGAVPGTYTVEIGSGDRRVIESTITAIAGQDALLRLPLASSDALDARTHSASGDEQQASLRLSLSETPLLAWVATRSDESTPGFHQVFMPPSALPRHSAAYSSIDAIVIDTGSMARLDERQLAALMGHVANCGATVLVATSTAAAGILRNSVGCGGARLAQVSVSAEAPAALAAMMSTDYDGPDAARGLRAASGPDVSLWRSVVLLSCGYLAAALVLLMLKPGPLALLAPGLLVTALVLVLGRTLDSTGSLLVWSEAQQGDKIAVYASRQLETGAGRGERAVPVIALLGHPAFCQGDRDSRWEFDSADGRYRSVRFEQRLLDSVSLCYAGHFPVSRSARIEFASGGTVSIQNTGAGTWPPAWFSSAGAIATLPTLAAGQTVIAGEPETAALPDTVSRALTRRTPSGGAALLWPLDLSAIGDSLARAEAWLMLRVPAREAT